MKKDIDVESAGAEVHPHQGIDYFRVSVRLNDNEYWNEMASVYTGRSHRAVFENNLDKIYDDIYTKLKNSK